MSALGCGNYNVILSTGSFAGGSSRWYCILATARSRPNTGRSRSLCWWRQALEFFEPVGHHVDPGCGGLVRLFQNEKSLSIRRHVIGQVRYIDIRTLKHDLRYADLKFWRSTIWLRWVVTI